MTRPTEAAAEPARPRAESSTSAARWLLSLAVLLAAAVPARAQEPARTVTLDEAVAIALEQNTDVQRARNDVRLRDVITQRERLDYLPELSLSSSGSRSFGRSFSQSEGSILSETNDFFDVDVSASMNLFNGFENSATLRRASLQEEASGLRLASTRQDVIFQVVEGFTALYLGRQLVVVRQQELEAQTDLLQQVSRLVDVGRRPVSDLYQQQAARAEAEVALVEAQRQAELAETRIIQVLELDPLETYDFVAPALADSSTTVPEADYELEALLELAIEQRADLHAAEVDVAATRQGVRAARAGYWPSLSLSFGYGSGWASSALQPVPGTGSDPRMVAITPDGGGPPILLPAPGTGEDPDFRRPDFLDQLDGRRGGSLRLSLNVPIFDRYQTRTQVEQARVQLLNARYDLQDQRQTVALQVREALLTYRSARAQLRAAEERFQAAQRAREAALRRYELGAATFVELAQASSAFVNAASARVQARYNVFLAQQMVEYFTGSLDVGAPALIP